MMTPEYYPAWSRSVSEVLEHHGLENLEHGLAPADVAERQRRFGRNELTKDPPEPLWRLVLKQFDDTLVKVLLAAAAVSFILAFYEEDDEGGLSAFVEPAVILLILVLNAIVGVMQEQSAESTLEALKTLQADEVTVIRGGKRMNNVPSVELVPGDVVELRDGDKVPADLRVAVIKTATLRVDQASLTGESEAVYKHCEEIADESSELSLKHSMLFSATNVVGGSCVGVVNDIGDRTEMGKIQTQIKEASEESDDTPLKRKLNDFGERLTVLIGVVCLVVWLINYKHFIEITLYPTFSVSFSFQKCTFYFKVAVALAVAAIPEGLPAVITTCLALGTGKMAKKNAITRNLPSVETLGCTTVICSDKTGTLTTNQMSAVRLVAPGETTASLRSFEVSGHTYDPEGGEVEGRPDVLDEGLAAVARVCALCNDSDLQARGQGEYVGIGVPTEVAMRVLVEKLGVGDAKAQAQVDAARGRGVACAASRLYAEQSPKLATLEFDRTRKSMSVLCRGSSLNLSSSTPGSSTRGRGGAATRARGAASANATPEKR